jgi:hypothetical protein
VLRGIQCVSVAFLRDATVSLYLFQVVRAFHPYRVQRAMIFGAAAAATIIITGLSYYVCYTEDVNINFSSEVSAFYALKNLGVSPC